MIPLLLTLLWSALILGCAWRQFTGQRSERVNASQDKTRLLDGSKRGIGIPAAKQQVIGANIFVATRPRFNLNGVSKASGPGRVISPPLAKPGRTLGGGLTVGGGVGVNQ